MTQLENDTLPLSYLVHPTDFTAQGEVAFAHALRLALAVKGHLCIVHAESLAADDDPDWRVFPGVRAMLSRWGLLARDAPRSAVAERLGLRVAQAIASDTDPARALGHFFEENRCDLLVLATHARDGLARLLHGSIAEPLARRARVPTLFLPLGARGFVEAGTGVARLGNVLLPVELATPSKVAVSLALRMADALGWENAIAHLLHVGPPGEAPAVTLDPGHEARVRRVAAEGAVVPAILETAARVDADLIVMATHGHDSLLDALRGSTTEQVLHQAGRAVLAIPVA
jgi:nucleotide-binding universal stress UspA family protein